MKRMDGQAEQGMVNPADVLGAEAEVVTNKGCVTDCAPAHLPMINIGIETVYEFGPIAYYGAVWLVLFKGGLCPAIVIEDPEDSPDENYLLLPAHGPAQP